ncbi:hypothetical protein GOBAR_AA29033 [Gossypium barbadense]|uniref:Uncharacterized protein n=1 Tax=Gossypium barbadense TaxID=3634 RepID=A0A2P5WKN2_GOSBA|nr:hypothetical protein GOBAR_AA29033 [Gossypium barbadense]
MLTKFMSVSETYFQNTETALKNQQASIQGLETQIGQLANLISERPQGSLPSNTESNPREQPNAITIQDEEGLVAPEPEPRQETMVSKVEVDHNNQKLVSKEYKPRMPYPNATRKDSTDEQFDKWRAHKPRTHDKPKPHYDDLNVAPNQLKVGDRVLLDAADTRIATSEPNGAIPLKVLSIFPYGTVEVIHPKFGTFKFSNPHGRAHGRALGRAHTTGIDTAVRHGHAKIGKKFSLTRDAISGHGRTTWSWASLSNQHKRAPRPCPPTVLKTDKKIHECSLGHRRGRSKRSRTWSCDTAVSTNTPKEHGSVMVQFCLGGLVSQLSVPEFRIALGLYMKEFMDENELKTLYRHIHYSPIKYWKDLVPASATYDPSRSKASALAPSLRYLHAILAHTLTGRRESTDVYRLFQSTEEEDPEDITDDVSPHHEDPPSQPPPIHRPFHSAASYSDIFIKSSKAHHQIGTKNSTSKGSPRLSCPARPRP